MLEQKVFLQGINYLKANYLNWAFDINNDLMLKVWYKKFANLEASTFMGMIESYTEYNKFPPNSPAELLEIIRGELEKKELDANEAWQETLRLISKYGIFYGKDKIYAELETKPALKKTFIQFERELASLRQSDTYTPEAFKKAYAVNLKRQVETNSCVLLGHNILFLN